MASDDSLDRDATIFVTRPSGDAEKLVDALRVRGRTVVALPVLGIEAVDDPSALARTMARLDDFRLVVFVSPNAIRRAFAHRVDPWPSDVAIGVMGPGSVDALRELGVAAPAHRVLSPLDALPSPSSPLSSRRRPGAKSSVSLDDADPDPGLRRRDVEAGVARFDSEALFAVLDDALRLSGGFDGRVLILRGNGGRAWFADRLRGLGIAVDEVEAYRRVRPALEPAAAAALRDLVARNAPAIFIATSSEGVDNLVALVDGAIDGARAWLLGATLLAPHARIGEAARAAGFARVVPCAPGDAGILAAIE